MKQKMKPLNLFLIKPKNKSTRIKEISIANFCYIKPLIIRMNANINIIYLDTFIKYIPLNIFF
jgi:hypothetical protein